MKKKTYTRKQIQESIKYWQKVLEEMNSTASHDNMKLMTCTNREYINQWCGGSTIFGDNIDVAQLLCDMIYRAYDDVGYPGPYELLKKDFTQFQQKVNMALSHNYSISFYMIDNDGGEVTHVYTFGDYNGKDSKSQSQPVKKTLLVTIDIGNNILNYEIVDNDDRGFYDNAGHQMEDSETIELVVKPDFSTDTKAKIKDKYGKISSQILPSSKATLYYLSFYHQFKSNEEIADWIDSILSM